MNRVKGVGIENLRYILGRSIASASFALGGRPFAALTHMHSARIYLTLKDIVHHGAPSGIPRGVRLLKRSLGTAASLSLLFFGDTPRFRILESCYLGASLLDSSYPLYGIFLAVRTHGRTGMLNRMLSKAAALSVCDLVELVAFAQGFWCLFGVVPLLRCAILLVDHYGEYVSGGREGVEELIGWLRKCGIGHPYKDAHPQTKYARNP